MTMLLGAILGSWAITISEQQVHRSWNLVEEVGAEAQAFENQLVHKKWLAGEPYHRPGAEEIRLV